MPGTPSTAAPSRNQIDVPGNGGNQPPGTIREFIGFSLLIFFSVVLPMALAGLLVGAAVSLLSAASWKPYLWMLLAPVVYLAWLIVFLALSAAFCANLGKKHPKPRHQVMKGGEQPTGQARGLYTAAFCYRRLHLINSLPLVPVLRELGPFRGLVMRAYSPSVHIGRQCVISGQLFDPDLTEIGDRVLVGAHSVISAHVSWMQPDGGFVYQTAPITIGSGVTIGGAAMVGAGATLEDDSIIEIGAIVLPFSRVPRGEVWGGNPARFLRKRDDVADPRPVEPPVEPPAVLGSVSADSRALVVEALVLRPEEITETLSFESCSLWDSMGQMSIAALISERYGFTVPAKQVPLIRTLQDVENLIGGRELSSTQLRSQAAAGAKS